MRVVDSVASCLQERMIKKCAFLSCALVFIMLPMHEL